MCGRVLEAAEQRWGAVPTWLSTTAKQHHYPLDRALGARVDNRRGRASTTGGYDELQTGA